MAGLWSAAVLRNLYVDGNTTDGIFLQTTHGDSITTYGGQRDKEYPLQGIFQGNGAKPARWVGVSSMIL